MSDFLKIQQINKTFQPDKEVRIEALQDINLEIEAGDFVVISGPSGSGKTTLLNIVGGLENATGGTVILDGQNVTGLAEKELSHLRRNHIGFIFQAYNLIPVLNVRENIEFIMKLQGTTQRACDQGVEEIAKKLHIDDLLKKLPHQLSGGQQQRVAVARAVAAEPKLILADEPTANLDSQNAATLMDMLEHLNQHEGITIIFSSHDPMVIERAKHSIVLKDGKVVSNERFN